MLKNTINLDILLIHKSMIHNMTLHIQNKYLQNNNVLMFFPGNIVNINFD